MFLKMQGSCSGCSSSQKTLKGGIERMLTHWIPEVSNVVAVSDVRTRQRTHAHTPMLSGSRGVAG